MKETPFDWGVVDAKTEEEIHAAALSDPDAQPLTAERLARMTPTPRITTMRRALGLSLEEFSRRYRIPLETLHDWTERRSEPDAIARAYLRVIGTLPEAVAKVFAEQKALAELG